MDALLWQGETLPERSIHLIWIDPYYRYRFDSWEYVSGHWRRLPT
jgi:hypothetical protein